MAGKTKSGQAVTDATEILQRRYVAGRPDAIALLDEVRADAEVARAIYRLRTNAGLTQQTLAQMVGTTASAISRLEDADYQGHSLAMLRRIAAALGRRVEIRFPPVRSAKNGHVAPAASARVAGSAGQHPSRKLGARRHRK